MSVDAVTIHLPGVKITPSAAQFAKQKAAFELTFAKLERLIEDLSAGDIEGAMQAAAELEAASSMVQGQVTTTNIKNADEARKEASKKMLEQLKEVLKKINEAMNAPKPDKVLGWFLAIAELVGGIVMTAVGVIGVAAGGSGVGLIAAGVALTVTGIMATGNMIAQETNATTVNAEGERVALNISWDGMVAAIVSQQIADGTIVVVRKNADGAFVDKQGNIIDDPRGKAKPGAIVMDEAMLAEWQMGWSLTTSILATAVLMVIGAGAGKAVEAAAKASLKAGSLGANAASGASSGAAQLSKSTSTALTLAEAGTEVLGSVTTIIEAINAVAGALLQMKLAEIDKDTEEARAWKAVFEATAKDLLSRVRVWMSHLEKIFMGVNDNNKNVSAVLKDSSETTIHVIGSTAPAA